MGMGTDDVRSVDLRSICNILYQSKISLFDDSRYRDSMWTYKNVIECILDIQSDASIGCSLLSPDGDSISVRDIYGNIRPMILGVPLLHHGDRQEVCELASNIDNAHTDASVILNMTNIARIIWHTDFPIGIESVRRDEFLTMLYVKYLSMRISSNSLYDIDGAHNIDANTISDYLGGKISTGQINISANVQTHYLLKENIDDNNAVYIMLRRCPHIAVNPYDYMTSKQRATNMMSKIRGHRWS